MRGLYSNNSSFEQRFDCFCIHRKLLAFTLFKHPDSFADGEGEGNHSFACPHSSCDGFTFETIQECFLHEDDWHRPPYFCAECDTTFAARPALKRHFKASGHFNWICLEGKCDMKGTLFANQSEFVTHALNTPGHEHLFPEEPLNSPVSVKRINYAEVTNIMEGETTEECLSEEEGQKCLEPACRRYQRVFPTESKFAQHKESHNHVHAIKYSEALRESGKSIADITTEQEAARALRCTAEGCPKFGEKLTTSQSFYYHIQTEQHVHPRFVSTSNPASPTAEIRMKFADINLACDEPECPKFQHYFYNKGNHTKHSKSVVHQKAVEFGTKKRSMGNSSTGGQEKVKAETPEREQPVAIMAPPVTPQIWSRSLFTPISPPTTDPTRSQVTQFVTPTKRPVQDIALMTPPSWREENLRKRNRELEVELEQMKEKMNRMRTAYQEQIRSLFQTLGETHDRSRR
ncbi:hypothetical protein TrVGV298_011979 [Trichoderma virens]|nr:hypothetical protein TrVGV298_011979 [Trichoderma virens]